MSILLAFVLFVGSAAATWHVSRKVHPAVLIAVGVILKVIGTIVGHAFPVVIGTSGERLGSIIYKSLSVFLPLLQLLGLIVIIHGIILWARRFRTAKQVTTGQEKLD